MYAMISTDKKGIPILTLKCEPNHAEALREN